MRSAIFVLSKFSVPVSEVSRQTEHLYLVLRKAPKGVLGCPAIKAPGTQWRKLLSVSVSKRKLLMRIPFAIHLAYGVNVPITSSVYGYTKGLTHNWNSKKTSGAAIG